MPGELHAVAQAVKLAEAAGADDLEAVAAGLDPVALRDLVELQPGHGILAAGGGKPESVTRLFAAVTPGHRRGDLQWA